jgi:hypothetical protein
MEHAKRVRVIKRGQSVREVEPESEAGARPGHGAHVSDAGREVRQVVSDWVREHRRRSEEFRRNYSTLLGEMGFKSPHSSGRAA